VSTNAARRTDAISRALERIDWDFADENPSAPNMRLNGVHWYPATFVAPLIATMLDILTPEPAITVLDPFCGSGTAVLEAWYRGHDAAGADSNQFAIDISRARVKLVRYGSDKIGAALASDFERWRARVHADRAALAGAAEWAAIAEEAERWFVPRALEDIALTKRWIAHKAPERWRAVLRVLLSALLKRSSRVRDYHYTYIVDRSRVKSPALDDPRLAELFATKVRATFRAGANLRTALSERGLTDFDSPPAFTRALAGNLGHIGQESIDLVLTSPPYFGMNDYVRSQYLTSLVYPSTGYQRDLVAESGSRRDRTKEPALRSYIDDMTESFRECRRVLRSGGLIAMFLGHSRSRLARENDVVGQLGGRLDELGFEAVWRGERRIRFRKITSTPSSSEAVWILRRN
jgi:DNA modification methylase